ncbi:hypothetical protein F4777DRAFT_587286 [Nemania sp. FL0916]|nr:hypothetical protein F4777DRAFT_587286 [Nemania sp. FL0916]
MPCCGSEDDYDTVTPYNPVPEKTHRPVPNSYNPNHYPQRQAPARRPDPRCEEMEKRQRQAQATIAARSYGWPTSREAAANHSHPSRNRDSMIEPGLASGLAAMPGSEFRAVYDPQRQRQQHQSRPQGQQQLPQRSLYYQQRSVTQQPSRVPPMVTRKPVFHEGRSLPAGRKPVIQTARPLIQPQRAQLVRRDSNGISECSDDDGDESWRDHPVSPI